jgi:hypothetical protein
MPVFRRRRETRCWGARCQCQTDRVRRSLRPAIRAQARELASCAAPRQRRAHIVLLVQARRRLIGVTVDKLYEHLSRPRKAAPAAKRPPKNKRSPPPTTPSSSSEPKRTLRQANKCMDVAARAWRTVRRLHPTVVPEQNPFEGVTREHDTQETVAATRQQAYALAQALVALDHPSLGLVALAAFEWHQRPENILAGHLQWSNYRPADRPRSVKVEHAKTLSRYRVIAFATHGLKPDNLDGLTQPALALSAPEVANVDGDGLLTVEKILGLKLNADWVVLSACNTAAGAGAGAEAVSGLGRAFFYAGSRSLLVTNWAVHSESARELVADVFHRQAGNPALSRAEALRQAMVALLDDGAYKDATGRPVFTYGHPFFWAPYSIIGDGG